MRYSTRNPALKNNARNLKRNMTLAEQRLWYSLRDKRLNGMKFRRQQTIGPYIVDFVCMEHKLIVELDGGQHAEQAVYDSKRTEFLNNQGYCVLRFWNNEVLQQTAAVLAKIVEMCGSRVDRVKQRLSENQ
ncbi:endonuclease domain-containing protein [Neisseria sp. ZJ106]|uniref:Endonuclease domain-containing protein n=1 Tax=Neisseria lisongii TaxID=2912188 RepID=A0AAW5AKH1_9NEIS|nr:endonuclease domain-containing protein [Neisseria lisongii]MCF7520957.1 endonuclease domain-containing protein [Neisseria lisongii]MCF7528984.1 endonuclease domain-containing protein [Neisseria lisongii]WCL71240.1 endonuclease domain-containing protein [Neisseria lisongii]